ncbi:methyltransferase domain-containing protein [Xanthomarina sp. F1114]|uniref:class I SAM-dependent methyltransferase n=1 Tax=Xanthomarina sp. F1114 TaxID=2996019 RepID=UPI00225E5A6D|nr:methyltransferase domain-containing protein [Xanthomarina sp. F1114]MCX7548041.1 methyltransferase domain-containing protein [Xanthomarina sp. F1114]
MKALDRFLQNERIKKAKKFIRTNDAVLDIGSVDGVMFEKWKKDISYSYGIDPILEKEIKTETCTLLPGKFPEDLPENLSFDIITMLAVLEHIPKEVQAGMAENFYNILKTKGRVIITVPSPQVDFILEILLKLRLIDGMSLEEHYGFKPSDTEKIFAKGFKLIKKKKFQLGLNNLYVFEKID